MTSVSVFTETLPANYMCVQWWEQPEMVSRTHSEILGKKIFAREHFVRPGQTIAVLTAWSKQMALWN